MPKLRITQADRCHITYIYALVEPDTGVVGYVGRSDQPFKRFMTHLSNGCTYRDMSRHVWINDCCRRGMPPCLQLLKIVPYTERDAQEKKYILALGRRYPLTNWEFTMPDRKPLPFTRGTVIL